MTTTYILVDRLAKRCLDIHGRHEDTQLMEQERERETEKRELILNQFIIVLFACLFYSFNRDHHSFMLGYVRGVNNVNVLFQFVS